MLRNGKLKKTSSEGMKIKSLHRLGLAAGAVLMLSTPLQAEDIAKGVRSEPSYMDPYFHNLGPDKAMLE